MAVPRSSTPLWDPERLFKIKNPEHSGDFTCVGWAPSKGRRCWNPIAYHNRVAAKQMLRDLSFVEPSKVAASEQQTQKLNTIAYYSLCRSYHQDQANKMVTKWMEILWEEQRQLDRRVRNERLQEISRNEEAEDADSESNSTLTRRNTPSRPIASAHLPESRAASISSQALPTPPSTPASRRERGTAVQSGEVQVPAASPLRFQWPPSGPLEFNWPPSNLSSTTPTQLPSPPATPPRVEEPHLEPPLVVESPATPPVAVVETPPSPPSPTTEPLPAPTPCAENHVVRRTTDEDCGICLTTMVNTPLQELVWCKASCGQSAHKECFNTWQSHQNADAQCAYWSVSSLSSMSCRQIHRDYSRGKY